MTFASSVSSDRLRIKGYEPQTVNASSSLVSGLSSRLRGLLQSQDLQNAIPGMSGHRIARNRVHRIKIGDPRLFLKKTPAKMVNTAIHLLVDNSTSMSANSRYRICRDVVLALTKTMGTVRGVNLGCFNIPGVLSLPRKKWQGHHSDCAGSSSWSGASR